MESIKPETESKIAKEYETNNMSNIDNSKNEKEISKVKSKSFCFKKGSTYIIMKDNNNNPIITIGPDWYFYIFLILFMTGGFLFLLIFYWQFLYFYLKISTILVYLIFFSSYTYLFLANPGIPKKIEESFIKNDKKNYLYCKVCKLWVHNKTNTKHCSVCNICIEGQDHHCAWTSKCIGKRNKIVFYFIIH